ncbi:hypothetical protein SAY87_031441 [Trapa incisa]|uniref:Flowering-promoting factor 1-like protein 3 n=2 Tax=Trapa TaxID=22665 RepID=A0AAN7MGI5_TRANT|nr:hypothetical protein SAY87_031441 [Trapa incisa]KAK4795606.1 hypothetical protein SAY86_027932 [Trapa natans]
MSGVWLFNNNGVIRRVENPGVEQQNQQQQQQTTHGGGMRRSKVLVYIPTGEVIRSYADLEAKLSSLGWERYYDDPGLLQFHKRSTVHLISLPKEFHRLKSMHMYDIVVKNRNLFEVRDLCEN